MTLTFSPVKELLLRVSSLFAGLFLLAPAELTLLPPRLVEEFLLRAPVVGHSHTQYSLLVCLLTYHVCRVSLGSSGTAASG